MAPSMTRRAMFWALSSLLLLVLAAVPHLVDAYYMAGRTVAVKGGKSNPQPLDSS